MLAEWTMLLSAVLNVGMNGPASRRDHRQRHLIFIASASLLGIYSRSPEVPFRYGAYLLSRQFHTAEASRIMRLVLHIKSHG
jgi:hypothetical protein